MGNKTIEKVVFIEIIVLLILIIPVFREKKNFILSVGDYNKISDSIDMNINEDIWEIGNINDKNEGQYVLTSSLPKLSAGVYTINVYYESQKYEKDNAIIDDAIGSISIQSKDNAFSVQHNSLNLLDKKTQVQNTIWIHSIADVRDATLYVYYGGIGNLQIKKIEICEEPLWKFIRIILWVAISLVVNLLMHLKSTIYDKDKIKVLVILSGIVCFSCLPLFSDFLFEGHDIWFHMNRISNIAQGLRNGNIFLPIQTEQYNGYGYASPLFYGQIFLYIPAILYNLLIPLQDCYKIYVVVINTVTCIVSFVSLKKIVEDDNIAFVGSLLYALSPYRMTCLYVRASVGEYTAMAFMPLVVWGVYIIYTTNERLKLRQLLPIIVGLSGMIQSHILSCEIVGFFLVFFAIVNWRKTFVRYRFIGLVRSAIITLCINAFFIMRFLDSMRMDIRVSHRNNSAIQQHGTYIMQLLELFYKGSGISDAGLQNDMGLIIGFPIIMGVGIFCFMFFKYKTEQKAQLKLGFMCLIIFVIATFMSTIYFPWDSLHDISSTMSKILCVVQFPWRYLSVATVCGVVMTVLGIEMLKDTTKRKDRTMASFLLIILVFVATEMFYRDISQNGVELKIYCDTDLKTMNNGEEYLLNGTSVEGFADRGLRFKNEVVVNQYNYSQGVTTFYCDNQSGYKSTVELPLQNYDNYHAYHVESGEKLEIQDGEEKRVAVIIPVDFQGTILVKYEIPFIWKIAGFISLISIIGVLANEIVFQRKAKI